MSSNFTNNMKFKELILSEKILVAGGCYDPLSAKILEKAGFECVFYSGAGAAVAWLGMPDIGLISYGEMIQLIRNTSNSINVPIYADGDNGYGNASNVKRTVQEYESAGVSGIQIDDLVLPKQYASADKPVIGRDELMGKVKAAIEARRDPNFVIEFRTGAAPLYGVEEAIVRSQMAVEAGADLIFVDMLANDEELLAIRQQIKGPLQVNMNEKGVTAKYKAEELEKMGFNIALFPVSMLCASAYAQMEIAHEILSQGSTINKRNRMIPPVDLYNFVGLKDSKDWEEKYMPKEKQV